MNGLFVDCRYVRIGRHDGISRFSAGIVTALAKLRPLTMIISDERQLELLPDLPWVLGPSPTAITEPLAALYFNRFEPDLVYTPMQTMGPWGRRFGLVTTVHDLIYYENRTPPRYLSPFVRLVWRVYHLWWGFQRGLLRRADAHVAVSETTRRLMLRHRLTPHPIEVVPNAADLRVDRPRERPAGQHLVYMGAFLPYKNVETLARMMHELPGYRLHLTSAARDSERDRLERLAPEGSLVFHQGSSDEEYRLLLGSATALVTASLNEGFGLPILEAMSLAVPVVVSDIPVFREVAGEAAVFADPRSPSAFAAAVRALEDPDQWRARSAAVLRASQGYSWEESARRLLAVLERVERQRGVTPPRRSCLLRGAAARRG